VPQSRCAETLGRMIQVMKSIGLGGSDSEVEFFRRLYRVFDTDRNGQVDFEELYTGLSSLLAGSARVKLQMFFDMFFTEERQTAGLSKFNVYKLFMAMLRFFGSPSELVEAGSSPKTRERSCEWTQVFRNIDVNHDGVVSFDELYLHVLAHPELCSFLDSAVLRFGAEIQYTPSDGVDLAAEVSKKDSSTASHQKGRGRKSKGLAGITERGSAAVNRALRQSALTNKVANRRTSYEKPWKQESKLEKTLPARRSSSDPSEERRRFASADAPNGGSFLPKVTSASESTDDAEGASSTSGTTAQLSSGLDLRLERSDSANSTQWSTEGTPPGSPTELPTSVRSGATSVRGRPITDSPSTWLLKNKQARQFVTASKTSNELSGGALSTNKVATAATSCSMFR
jgi:Ca2+-binding EF-hand superfamily protein